jgi:molecular chaperone HscB
MEAWSKSFKEAFSKRDFDSAISCTQRMRYYYRALEEITKKS